MSENCQFLTKMDEVGVEKY